ncbi:MAG: nucleotidyltransferase domain-containing protein [Gemmatimonadota bacterium]|nr:nucleotidyltransferase domain-containing protein [Gemmatimonadota bacterium]
MNTPRNAPDPVGLTIARRIQQKSRPAEIILAGSRAAGDHRPDSDVDLIAIAPDDDGAERTKAVLKELLEGKRDVPVVNVVTITRKEFQRTAPLAQSLAGQTARHGVTPDGKSLKYRAEREPAPDEIRELTLYWLGLAERHLAMAGHLLEERELCHVECLGRDAQWGLERSFKGLLAAGNDPVRFRRDAAFLWRHVESLRPIRDRQGAQAVENLLAATAMPGGLGCSLTAFSEAYRRGIPYPDLSDEAREEVKRWIKPALDALTAEALARSGAVREDLRTGRRSGLGLPPRQ